MTIKSLDETSASLIIISEVLSGQQIADKLDTKPTKIVLKGTPTEQADVPQHPLHMAIFASGLGVEAELEKHIESILDMCERRKETLLELLQDCRITVHCSYFVHDQGGWTISRELCQRMASLPLEFVFSIERRGRGPHLS